MPVVSVGNLTLGGTGKTPCVEYIARLYGELGRRPVVLSRGYGASGALNDEALVLRHNLPNLAHLQGRDRARLARRAVRELAADVLILDDGFQHRRVARDLDIVLIDATEPWGHGHLFPRGLLREVREGLRRADLVLLTRCDLVAPAERKGIRDMAARLAPGLPVVESMHRPVDLVDAEGSNAMFDRICNAPIAAFCGIGNPDAFRSTLTRLGASLCAFRAFPDHHRYTASDIDWLHDWVRSQAKDCVVVTTQKDLVKLRLSRLGDRPLCALRVRLHPELGRETLDRKLKEVLR